VLGNNVVQYGILLVVLASVAPASATWQARQPAGKRLTFVDEAASEPDVNAFRQELVARTRAQDVRGVLSLIEPGLRARFERSWSDLPPGRMYEEDGSLKALQRLLALGGSFTTTRGAVYGRREFCAPYVYSAFPRELPPALEGEIQVWAIISGHAPVRAKRSRTATVITYLSYDLVKADGWLEDVAPSNLRWAEVTLAGGRTGFVEEGMIWKPSDWHACFAKVDGRWSISSFARGVAPVGSVPLHRPPS
jgi:hypothetical protein